MHTQRLTRPKESAYIIWFLIELVVYAVVVTVYYLFVLHFMGDWLKRLFEEHRIEYTAVALALLIGQGIGLELLTSWFFTKIQGKAK
jgi:hypothetical protein